MDSERNQTYMTGKYSRFVFILYKMYIQTSSFKNVTDLFPKSQSQKQDFDFAVVFCCDFMA